MIYTKYIPKQPDSDGQSPKSFVLRPEDAAADKLAFRSGGNERKTSDRTTKGASSENAKAGTEQAPPSVLSPLEVSEADAAPNSASAKSDRRHPEIVLTETSDRVTAERTAGRLARGILPSPVMLTAVCVLCMVSFLLGCSVTDSALCRVMIAISSATVGRIPAGRISDDSSASSGSFFEDGGGRDTVYQKYQSDLFPEDAGMPPANGKVSYLAVAPAPDGNDDGASPGTEKQPSVPAVLPAQNAEDGKIGSDGEILYPVMARDISTENLYALSNETGYAPDVHALAAKTPAALENLVIREGEPLVLVIHTHGTESYNECTREGFYDAAGAVRSEDTARNVVGIGAEIAEVLNGFGIPTLHSEKMCDKESFVRAYATSAAEVKTYLEKYPSIRFVIDLHRDSITAADGVKTKPVFSFAGEQTAQLMFVVGTDAAGAVHPGWQDNLSLALTLQKDIAAGTPGLFRRINLRSASFNQQLSNGYLLLECGSCANSREEASAAARFFATGFARVIKQHVR